MTKRVLVTGGGGQLGTAFRMLGDIAGHAVVAPDRSELDITNTESIANAMRDDLAAVINCAAFTEVDGAESAESEAFALNAAAPGALAKACNRAGIPLIHFSTDYVFDGQSDRPYSEDDETSPQSVYGRSKLAGEQAIVAEGGAHVVIRTAWVVSPWRKNFVRTMIRLAGERDELRIVADQHGSPTSAADLAQAVSQAMPQLLARTGGPEIYHLVNAGEASWYDLAERVMVRLGEAGRKRPRLVPITTAEYPTPASRPANSRLATAKFEQAFGLKMRGWEDAVDDVVQRCIEAEQEAA